MAVTALEMEFMENAISIGMTVLSELIFPVAASEDTEIVGA